MKTKCVNKDILFIDKEEYAIRYNNMMNAMFQRLNNMNTTAYNTPDGAYNMNIPTNDIIYF